MKKKDKLYCVIFFVLFFGIIGLLMAWNDGYLDGTFLDKALSFLLPALLVIYLVVIIITWIRSKLK